MAQELAFIGVVIYREKAKLSDLSDIVADCCCKKEVPVELRISCGEIVAKLGNT